MSKLIKLGQQIRQIQQKSNNDYQYYPTKIPNKFKKIENTANSVNSFLKNYQQNSSYFGNNRCSPREKQKSSLPKHQKFGMTSQQNQKSSRSLIANQGYAMKPLRNQRSKINFKVQADQKTQQKKRFMESVKSAQRVHIKNQYYQPLKTDKKQARFKQIQNWQSNKKQLQNYGLKNIQQVTFSMDSTSPETDQKQPKNDYNFAVQKKSNKFNNQGKNSLLNNFRKKIISKQIQQKQKQYRSYIRSSSKEQNQNQRSKIKSKMKIVLNQIYQLQKWIKE